MADQGADDRRDNGFTQTLTPDEIDALSDDPDEMAEQLAQMAGPGAQIFVDGFRGGRLPPKDQIQQIRFNSNSFSAEYHEAGMVRVEVITRPGMGGWRGRANFGFRDESLNARNAFAATKEPTQQERYKFSFQGPIAKGKTGISMSVDGNNAYDSRTIRGAGADRRQRQRAGQEHDRSASTRTSASTTRSAQSNQSAGRVRAAARPIAATLASGTSTCRSAPTTPTGQRYLPVAQHPRHRQEGVQRAQVRVHQQQLRHPAVLHAPTSASTTRSPPVAPARSGDRSSREIEIAQNFDFTIRRKHAMRAGVLLEAGWWNSTQQQNGNGTYVFTSIDAFNLGQPSTYTIRVGDPLVEYSQVKAGWFLQDDVRLGEARCR